MMWARTSENERLDVIEIDLGSNLMKQEGGAQVKYVHMTKQRCAREASPCIKRKVRT